MEHWAGRNEPHRCSPGASCSSGDRGQAGRPAAGRRRRPPGPPTQPAVHRSPGTSSPRTSAARRPKPPSLGRTRSVMRSLRPVANYDPLSQADLNRVKESVRHLGLGRLVHRRRRPGGRLGSRRHERRQRRGGDTPRPHRARVSPVTRGPSTSTGTRLSAAKIARASSRARSRPGPRPRWRSGKRSRPGCGPGPSTVTV